MNTHDQIKAAFQEAIDTTKEVTQEAVTQAVAQGALQAAERLGPGVFVKGWLTAAELLFTFKRPTLGIRERFAFPLLAAVAEAAQEGKSKRKAKDDAGAGK